MPSLTNLSDPAAAAAAVPPGLAANASLAAELVACFTQRMACGLLARLLGVPVAGLPANVPAAPLSLHPSVYLQPYLVGSAGFALAPGAGELMARAFLAQASAAAAAAAGLAPFNVIERLAQARAPDVAACKAAANNTAAECVAGQCVVATAWYHDAPATGAAAQRNLTASTRSTRAPRRRRWTPCGRSPTGPRASGRAVLKDSDSGRPAGALAAGVATLLVSLPGGLGPGSLPGHALPRALAAAARRGG